MTAPTGGFGSPICGIPCTPPFAPGGSAIKLRMAPLPRVFDWLVSPVDFNNPSRPGRRARTRRRPRRSPTLTLPFEPPHGCGAASLVLKGGRPDVALIADAGARTSISAGEAHGRGRLWRAMSNATFCQGPISVAQIDTREKCPGAASRVLPAAKICLRGSSLFTLRTAGFVAL
jgi:hypothetical protein